MISSSFFGAALAILAVNGVQAGPCRPTSIMTTETSIAAKGETTTALFTTELSVVVTETTADEQILTTLSGASVTPTRITTISGDASLTLTTNEETTTASSTTKTATLPDDISSTETLAEDTTALLITTTMQTLPFPTTSASTTTTSTASENDSCADSMDCLLSLNPLCALGLCTCVSSTCAPLADLKSCTLSSQCDAGQGCQEGICVDSVACSSADDCTANLDLCAFTYTCTCMNGLCSLLGA